MPRIRLRLSVGVVAPLALVFTQAGFSQEVRLGAHLEGLLVAAREGNPEFAGMQFEADAAAERGAARRGLARPQVRHGAARHHPDGRAQSTLLPGRVGSTRYIFTQELPWFGKRGLKREAAELQAEAARGRVAGTWSESAAKIKTAYAQLYYLDQK